MITQLTQAIIIPGPSGTPIPIPYPTGFGFAFEQGKIGNILSAAIGHGGWGLVGANVLVNFTEVLVAWLAFKGMKKITTDLFSQAGVATFAGLLDRKSVV